MASVYSADGGRFGTVNVKGDVEFGLVYNLHTGSLELAIKQCKDLAAVDTKRNRSDPWVFKWFHCKETKSNWISNSFFFRYVKVYLLPDKSKSGKRKTKVKKHTLNPVFDEMLKVIIESVWKRHLGSFVRHRQFLTAKLFIELTQPFHYYSSSKCHWKKSKDGLSGSQCGIPICLVAMIS